MMGAVGRGGSRPKNNQEVSEYVLDSFSKQEQMEITEIFNKFLMEIKILLDNLNKI